MPIIINILNCYISIWVNWVARNKRFASVAVLELSRYETKRTKNALSMTNSARQECFVATHHVMSAQTFVDAKQKPGCHHTSSNSNWSGNSDSAVYQVWKETHQWNEETAAKGQISYKIDGPCGTMWAVRRMWTMRFSYLSHRFIWWRAVAFVFVYICRRDQYCVGHQANYHN